MRMSEQEVGRDWTRAIVDCFYDVQDMRIRITNRFRAGEVKSERVLRMIQRIKDAEHDLSAELREQMLQELIYVKWLKGVKGIGPTLTAGLISWFGYCENFDTVSKLWAYTGYHVISRCRVCEKRHFNTELEMSRWIEKMIKRYKWASDRRKDKSQKFDEEGTRRTVLRQICKCGDNAQPYRTSARRKVGELIEWNPKAKVLCWKIGKQFIMMGKGYRELYDKFKASYELREDLQEGKGARGHRDMMAMRKMIKIFLSHYWEMSRKMKGLPVRPPYVMEKMNHTGYLEPIME